MFTIFFFVWSYAGFSTSADSLASNPITPSKPATLKASNHSFFMGSGYGSNLLYAGSSISDNQSYLSADFTYSFMSSFWSSLILYNLPGKQVTIPLYDIAAGYNHTFNKWFDASVSLSSYQTSSQIKDELYENFAYFRMSLGFDWMYVYTRPGIGKILEKDSGIYLYVRNSRYMSTPVFGKGKSYFSFDPSVNFLFGNYSQLQSITQPHLPERGRPGRPDQTIGTTETYEITDSFTMIQTEFSLPVAFAFYNFSFEAEPVYLIPMLDDEAYAATKGFHFFFNIIYRVF